VRSVYILKFNIKEEMGITKVSFVKKRVIYSIKFNDIFVFFGIDSLVSKGKDFSNLKFDRKIKII